ncbi:MAG: triose-phosphate isomerase [Desulfobacterales bacterium]|nr:triose-phosphate isomerase [Desulfobacterales bacterium]
MTTRTPLIAGNWKMYKTGPEAVAAAQSLRNLTAGVSDVDVMIAPAFTALAATAGALEGSMIAVGAQNLHWESEGAYTGEISPGMIRTAGCRYVIIGHSERRQLFGETDQTVNRKVKAALSAGLIPILCIGETEAEREAEQTFSVLDKQVRLGLEGVSLQTPGDIVIAYEPVWAIGTGKTATREQAQEAHAFIRELLGKLYGEGMAEVTRILYGGSVKPDNIAALIHMADIDGALVGGASLEPETFARIVRLGE